VLRIEFRFRRICFEPGKGMDVGIGDHFQLMFEQFQKIHQHAIHFLASALGILLEGSRTTPLR